MKARLFRSDGMAERLGEVGDTTFVADSFQLTYEHLRDTDGRILAEFDGEHWLVGPKRRRYSDVVFYS
jgi:hypothetical protein